MKNLKKKILKKYDGLVFNEIPHTYEVEGKRLPSVSGKIKKYYKAFDKRIAKYSAIKYNTTEEKILKQWADINKESIDRGHRVHLFGENYCLNNFVGEPSCPQEEALVKFWKELPSWYKPLFFELKMFHHTYDYAGTADIILLDQRDGSLVIADYKTNKNLFKQYKNQKMLAPFSFLDDTPYNHYQLQFSYYQILLEQTGLTVSDRMLIYLKLDGTYKVFHTNDYTEKLLKELKA